MDLEILDILKVTIKMDLEILDILKVKMDLEILDILKVKMDLDILDILKVTDRIMQSKSYSLGGDVVLDIFNNASRDEDNILYQIYIKQICIFFNSS